jgi:hypothetical protein
VAFEEKRLFHRYPSGLRVAFRIGGTGYRGKVVNVSAAGGFVATKAPPTEGARVQMAAQVDRTQPSVWLDLRVTWVVAEASDALPTPGFGGFWLHASSRYGEEPLRTFLSDVLGITKPVIRPMTPPSGGPTVHVYRFPDIYDGTELSDLPWWAARQRHPQRRPAVLAPAPAGKTASPGATPSSTVEVRLPPSDIRVRDSRARGITTDDAAPVPAGLSQNTGVFFADVADEIEAIESRPDSQAAAATEESRWGNLVKKLSGFRTRGSGARESDASKLAPNKPIAGLPVAEFVVGRKSTPATLQRIGTGWVVFVAPADTKPPEVWSRLVVVLKPPPGKKGDTVEVHATVTRTKDSPEGAVVHCKVNRVDEHGHTGTYSGYVDLFNSKLPG